MNNCIFFIAIILLLFSCAKDPNGEALPAPKNPNLKYFGFSLVDVFFDDPSDSDTKTNYSDEVAPFSNIADILVAFPEQNIVSNLEIMDGFRMKAYLHLIEIFFEIKKMGGVKSGVIYGIRADFKERWYDFISVNNLEENQKYIEAFYIGEEPFWNGIPYDDFEKVTDFVKASFPNVNILMVEAYLAVEEMIVPASVDWVGFDHYFIKDPSTENDFQAELALLKTKITEEQSIILVLDSHFIPLYHGLAKITKNNLDAVARNYYTVANSDKQIVGMIGYYWPNGFEFENATGARGLPEHVRNEYDRIGKAITRK